MNVFLYETKAQLKSFLVWTASLVGLLVLFGAAFFGMFMAGKEAVQAAISGLPPEFAAVFGIQIDAIFSYGGFFQFTYTYLAVVGAIMATSLALSAFAREKRAKCTDFLFTKPVRRGRLFLSKLLSCLALVAGANILFLAASILCYLANGEDPSGLGTLTLASLSLMFMQLVFLSMGVLYAVLARKVRSVSGAATAFGFAGFILAALCSLTGEEAFRYISPLNYFNPTAVFETGGFEANYAVAAAVVAVLCLAAAFACYCKSDAHAV